jgi:hypothetical protein
MITRGIKNNNPLNIRKGNKWKGELPNQTDNEFEQFQSMIYGLRAGFKILYNYYYKYRLKTISDIISRWAPPVENDTNTYIKNVCKMTKLNSTDRLNWNYSDMSSLLKAMCKQESNYIPNDNELYSAFRLI